MSDIETQLQQRPSTQVVSSLRVEVVDGPDRGLSVVGGDTISVGTARDNALVDRMPAGTRPSVYDARVHASAAPVCVSPQIVAVTLFVIV